GAGGRLVERVGDHPVGEQRLHVAHRHLPVHLLGYAKQSVQHFRGELLDRNDMLVSQALQVGLDYRVNCCHDRGYLQSLLRTTTEPILTVNDYNMWRCAGQSDVEK